MSDTYRDTVFWISVCFWIPVFHDGGSYNIESSSLIYSANQWTGFYVIETSFIKELNTLLRESTSMHTEI